MKKNILIFTVFVMLFSCQNNIVEKPKTLIEKDKMKEIIYDLAVLEAMKSQNPSGNAYPTATELLKNKYKIDSITFAQNTKYYASNAKEYKKMYQEVNDKFTQEIDKLNGGKQEAPTSFD